MHTDQPVLLGLCASSAEKQSLSRNLIGVVGCGWPSSLVRPAVVVVVVLPRHRGISLGGRGVRVVVCETWAVVGCGWPLSLMRLAVVVVVLRLGWCGLLAKERGGAIPGIATGLWGGGFCGCGRQGGILVIGSCLCLWDGLLRHFLFAPIASVSLPRTS